MSLSTQREFAPTIAGLSSYLTSCPSAALGLAVGDEVRALVKKDGLSTDAGLTPEFLNQLRAGLNRRNQDAVMQQDMLMMIADAMGGSNRVSSGNPVEDRARFVEVLIDQLHSGGRVNFSRAFATAIG